MKQNGLIESGTINVFAGLFDLISRSHHTVSQVRRARYSSTRLSVGRVDVLVVVILVIGIVVTVATVLIVNNMINQSEDHVKAVRKTKVGYSEAVHWSKDITEYERAIQADLRHRPKKMVLDYTQFDLSEKCLEWIGQMSWLKKLTIEQSNVKDEWLKHLEPLELSTLDLFATRITDAGTKHIGKIKSLTAVNLGATGVTDAGIDALLDLQKLRTLRLDATLVTDDGVGRLAKVKSLLDLNLSDTGIKGLCFEPLSASHSIRILDISGTNISTKGLENLRKMSSVVALVLARCEIDDEDLKLVARLNQISELQLDRNPISDAGLRRLGTMKNLATLTLRDCPLITDGGVASLKKSLPHCTIDRTTRFRPMIEIFK